MIVSLGYTQDTYGNAIFQRSNPNNYDNHFEGFIVLFDMLKKKEISVGTEDQFLDTFPDVHINVDLYGKRNGKKNILLLLESNIVNKKIYRKIFHKKFDIVLTWFDDLVDNKKYFKIYLPNFPFNGELDWIPDVKRSKNVAMIASNKYSFDKNELYSKRLDIIKYFEKSGKLTFGLYGKGWNIKTFSRILKIFNKLNHKFKLFKNNFNNYKGFVESKKEILTNYDFAVCYENSKDINGYVTEKIFDCWLAGCVPIYMGCQKFINEIPSDVYIDARLFKSPSALERYILSLSEEDIVNYRVKIYDFLFSGKLSRYLPASFAETLYSKISSYLG